MQFRMSQFVTLLSTFGSVSLMLACGSKSSAPASRTSENSDVQSIYTMALDDAKQEVAVADREAAATNEAVNKDAVAAAEWEKRAVGEQDAADAAGAPHEQSEWTQCMDKASAVLDGLHEKLNPGQQGGQAAMESIKVVVETAHAKFKAELDKLMASQRTKEDVDAFKAAIKATREELHAAISKGREDFKAKMEETRAAMKKAHESAQAIRESCMPPRPVKDGGGTEVKDDPAAAVEKAKEFLAKLEAQHANGFLQK